jgi:hypothetical protein
LAIRAGLRNCGPQLRSVVQSSFFAAIGFSRSRRVFAAKNEL